MGVVQLGVVQLGVVQMGVDPKNDLFFILGRSFLGDVALTKVVSEYLFGYLKCMGHVKMGTFGKSAHILVQKKCHLGYRNKNYFATFISPTSPKNCGIVFGFKRLPLFGWFSANF